MNKDQKKESNEIESRRKKKRVEQLVKMGRSVLIKAVNEDPKLKMKNIQFKKIVIGFPEKNIKRSTEEIAELIYHKEISK